MLQDLYVKFLPQILQPSPYNSNDCFFSVCPLQIRRSRKWWNTHLPDSALQSRWRPRGAEAVCLDATPPPSRRLDLSTPPSFPTGSPRTFTAKLSTTQPFRWIPRGSVRAAQRRAQPCSCTVAARRRRPPRP